MASNNWFIIGQADQVYTNIVSKIITDTDLVKCLYYSESDALTKSTPTQEQIFAMLKQTDRENCRIFNIAPTYFVTEQVRAEIRIYETKMSSTDSQIAAVTYAFDVLCHQTLWTLDDGGRRVMKIINGILETLNGENVGGIGKMRFFNPKSPDFLKLQFYNDVFCGYKLFGNLFIGGGYDRC